MNVAIKILLESLKVRPGCNGGTLKLDPQLFDLLVRELKAEHSNNPLGTGVWVSDEAYQGRPRHVFLYGTKVTHK